MATEVVYNNEWIHGLMAAERWRGRTGRNIGAKDNRGREATFAEAKLGTSLAPHYLLSLLPPSLSSSPVPKKTKDRKPLILNPRVCKY